MMTVTNKVNKLEINKNSKKIEIQKDQNIEEIQENNNNIEIEVLNQHYHNLFEIVYFGCMCEKSFLFIGE